MTSDENASKLHIDSDWKAEAQKEKERLAAQEETEKAKDPSDAPGPGQLPEANMKSLVSILAFQAMSGLGMYGDPESGRVNVDPDGARFNIDLLGVLEEKTAGNLTDEESTELKQVVVDLRSRYVQIMQLLAQQAATPGADVAGTGPAGPIHTES